MLPNFVKAANFYVATNGNDSTGDGSIGNPWLTPKYGATQLASGDTLYLRGGTYDNVLVENISATIAILPAATNTTIASYPDEEAIITGNGGVAPTGWVIGANSLASGMTIRDLTIKGAVVIFSATDVTIENCDISVGGDLWTGNLQGEIIYVQGGINTVIQNNVLHDSTNQPGGSGDVVLVYKSDGLIVQNNEIYGSARAGINVKDTSNNATIRYNFIHDNVIDGIWTANQANPFVVGSTTYTMTDNLNIYQNIITNNSNGNGINLSIHVKNVHIFNNTFYYNGNDYYHANSQVYPIEFFNNISFNPVDHFLYWPGGSYSSMWNLSYLDYNNYYRAVGPIWDYRYTDYTTLAAWQTAAQSFLAGSEENSVTTDPGFMNASGNFNTPADFRRVSYVTNGRGGSSPSVIGAYITGNEVIGVNAAPADTIAPGAPSGLGVL